MTRVIDLSGTGGMSLALLPEIVLAVWTLIAMLIVSWRHSREEDQRLAGYVALAGFVSSLLALWWLWAQGAESLGPPHMVALDPFRYASSTVFLIGAIATVLLSFGYLGRERIRVPEYYVLLMFATVGMMLMGGAADLLVLFLALELMSVAVYVLAGIKRTSGFAAEAALKYFLLGAFASGFLLYGIALTWGATGSTNLAVIGVQVGDPAIGGSLMLYAGVALLLVGFAFKVAAVPFHMWAPDVYDGAPTPVTAYMAAAVKAAGFAAFVRLMVYALGGDAADMWQGAVWWLAVITMVAGNLVALSQRRLKRMLAYSSISHAGYLLVAVTAGSAAGAGAFLFYALVYTLMTVGAFGLLAWAGRDGERDVLIDDMAGLAQRRPWLAFAMAVFMLSLLGFPGTAGFIGKWLIVAAALEAGQPALVVVLVVASVVSAGYYLPVIMAMYMKEGRQEAVEGTAFALPAGARAVVGVAAVLLLLFGVWPNRAIDLAREGGDSLRPAVMMVER